MIRIGFLLSILLVSIWAAPTLDTMKKEHRVALVIGNSNYDEHELVEPSNNARQVKKFLEDNGFYVYYGENLDKRNFVRLLRKFNKKLSPNGVGLVYYSGHSVQTKGKNYIVTIDNGILNESMIVSKSISLDSIYRGMEESYNRLNIVVLDTAFDKPFGSIFQPKKRGLATVNSPKAQVTFSASQANSINRSTSFTQDFLSLVKKRGLELSELQTELIDLRQHHRQQKPLISIAKNQPFYFVLPDHIPAPDELAYSKIKESSSTTELKKFINLYPKSVYTKRVQEQLKAVEQEEAALKEKKRLELEAQAAEAMQKAKEAAAKEAETNALAKKNEEAKALAEKQAQEEAAALAEKEKNDIALKLTKPEDVVEQAPVKPKEGEERLINLE